VTAAQRRPNVLFIITDQQRADHTCFGGNTTVRTPALDSVADRGVVFDEGWVSNPVCMPNRSTIMTGRMPTAHGVIFNDRSLEWGAMTHVRAFRDAGWRTALIGKSHLQHGMSRNAVLPFDRIGAVDDPWPDGWQHLEDSERYEQSIPPWPDDFYGFGHVELTIDHGARVSGHHLHWALDRGGRYEDLVVPMSDESPARRRSDRWWQIYEPPYGPELHSTTFVTERTIAFIEDAAGSAQPWLAWASFPDPHHPMTPPGEWFDRHDPDDIELPATVGDTLETAPRHLQITRARTVADQFSWVTPFGVHDHQLVREAIASTYGAIEMIDDGIGQILAAVDRADQTDDTIVVFTSDHGDMMGDHGLMTKGFIHYRGTLQVPFVIADPTRPAARTQSLASSIDLGPTLLDLCGLPGYAGIQGNSLVPILDDPATSVRDHVLVEDDAPARLAKVAKFPEKSRTLITPGTRYTRLSTGEDQLFDLAADPDETVELSERKPALRAQMIERLADALIAADDDARGAPLIPTG
jgi:arylsulfatase A-like enzyme